MSCDESQSQYSDRGSQYTSSEYGKHLSVMGMQQASHSGKGQCWDNAPTVSNRETFETGVSYLELTVHLKP